MSAEPEGQLTEDKVYDKKAEKRILLPLWCYGPVYIMPPTPVYCWLLDDHDESEGSR